MNGRATATDDRQVLLATRVARLVGQVGLVIRVLRERRAARRNV